jgi:hypothetical protein
MKIFNLWPLAFAFAGIAFLFYILWVWLPVSLQPHPNPVKECESAGGVAFLGRADMVCLRKQSIQPYGTKP